MTAESDYFKNRHDVLSALHHIGRGTTKDEAMRRMSAPQAKRARGKNFMTDETWAWRFLADRSLAVEISYGWFLDKPLYGVTVFCIGELKDDAPEWDHALSSCYDTVSELLDRLNQLNTGGRERIEALAAQG